MSKMLVFQRRNIVFQLPPENGLSENYTNGNELEVEVDDQLADCLLCSNDVSLAEKPKKKDKTPKKDK